MNDVTLKTEWLEQIALLAAGGSSNDVISFCNALSTFLKEGRRQDMTVLAAMAYNPITADIERERDKREKRAAAGRARWANAKADLEQCSSDAQAMLEQSISKEEEERERENEKEKKQKKEIKEKAKEGEEDAAPSDIPSGISSVAVRAASEKSAVAPVITAPPVITFPLNNGEEFPVTSDIFAQLRELYPACDTMQTLRTIRGWCIANPENRKTKRGAMRFLHNWFSRDQDRARARPVTPAGNRKLTPLEVAALPIINPFDVGGTKNDV